MGDFDLDPCSPENRPWNTAKDHYTIKDNGMIKKWYGRVWVNPPYGQKTWQWIKKLAEHGNGIALIFTRTETYGFHSEVWSKADSILFICQRLFFYNVDGTRAKHNSGSPSCLVAYGKNNTKALRKSNIKGFLVTEFVDNNKNVDLFNKEKGYE